MTGWWKKIENRKKRRPKRVRHSVPLTIHQILGWADEWHARCGRWPNKRSSGRIPGSLGEKWITIEAALISGCRGLPRGLSLAKVLQKHRGRRNPSDLPDLSASEILAWAKSYHRRTGEWPQRMSGPIPNTNRESWLSVDFALRKGIRGLPVGSLAQFLHERLGTPYALALPRFTEDMILQWADSHHERTGRWPSSQSGEISAAPDESWRKVDLALIDGTRGLPGGSSLAQLLERHRGTRHQLNLPKLSVKMVVGWAKAHRDRTGAWPKWSSGPIIEAPGETWLAIQDALKRGKRGLPGGTTLARFLFDHADAMNRLCVSRLSEEEILHWADRHYRRYGMWPKRSSGAILGAKNETWKRIDWALRDGSRGLKGGSSLACLLDKQRGVRNRNRPPPLTEAQVLQWADAHRQRTGAWPNAQSGPIVDAPGEKWGAVNAALNMGLRSFAGGSSLAALLKSAADGAKATRHG